MKLPTLKLRKQRDYSARCGHPWIFSGAVKSVPELNGGDLVEVVDHKGNFVGRGYYNAHSQIAVRLLSWDPAESIDSLFMSKKVKSAFQLRHRLGLCPQSTDLSSNKQAFRLINSESDGLPGVVVDAYGPFFVIQIFTKGMELLKPDLVKELKKFNPQGILERSKDDLRLKEGLEKEVQTLAGICPEDCIEIWEGDCKFAVDIGAGQKTGFYLDQRYSRERLKDLVQHYKNSVNGRPINILNAFSYTGAFGVVAANVDSDIHVTNVDSSEPALEVAKTNFEWNDCLSQGSFVCAKAFDVLRGYKAEGRKWDVIILDPPKFAPSKRGLSKALRVYRELNQLGMSLLEPGGFLLTYSCSGAVKPDIFQKVISEATLAAGREAQIVEKLGGGGDHPVMAAFPDGDYLKGFLIYIG